MVRRTTSVLVVAALLTVALASEAAAAPAPAPPAARPRGEWLALEASPLWLHLYSRPSFPEQSLSSSVETSRVALGGGGTLRFFRVGLPGLYWTPLQLGLGVGAPVVSFFLHASTELGGRLPGLGERLELGGALGAGVVVVTYAVDCDGDCFVGGMPVVFSPVLRFTLNESPRFPVSVITRAIVPLARPHSPSSHFHGWGTIVMFGLELAVTRAPITGSR
jgi:hypothetical protein